MGVVSDYKRATGHIGRYEYEAGTLVKIDGMRPDYMDGYRLMRELRTLASEYLKAQVEISTLKARIQKAESDAAWAEFVRHAERSGGTL